jgi:hypothetical protein
MVLACRDVVDALRNLFVVGLMIAVGAAIGFRFHAGHAALAAVALAVATGLAFSWLNLLLSLAVREPESAGLAGRIRAGRRKGEGPRSRVIGLWRRRRRQRILARREMVCHGNGHT